VENPVSIITKNAVTIRRRGKMKSESIKEISAALAKFQGQITSVKKDAINPYFKSRYATLDTIWDTIRKPLSDNGLSVTQTMNFVASEKPLHILDTTLYHTSGEWISGSMILNPVKDDPQGLGSAISYARRYSLSAILGIVADEDDDANEATTEKPVSPPVETPQKTETLGDITPAQVKKIYATAREKNLSPEEAKAYIKKTFNKTSTKELTKAEASVMIEYLNEIKAGEPPLVRAAKEMGGKEVS